MSEVLVVLAKHVDGSESWLWWPFWPSHRLGCSPPPGRTTDHSRFFSRTNGHWGGKPSFCPFFIAPAIARTYLVVASWSCWWTTAHSLRRSRVNLQPFLLPDCASFFYHSLPHWRRTALPYPRRERNYAWEDNDHRDFCAIQ